MVNTFVESRVLQLTPNYPPDALMAVREKGGTVFSAGEIGHAFTYAPHVEGIEACDIDETLTRFYSELKCAMRKLDFEELPYYLDGLHDSISENGTVGNRLVSAGPDFYLPFLRTKEQYDSVKNSLDRISIHCADCPRFLDTRDKKAGMIFLNNIPEYIEEWQDLFANLPIENDGILMFAKRDNEVYIHGDSISPGILKSYGGYLRPGKDWQTTDVVSALKRFGYAPIDLTIVSDISYPTTKDPTLSCYTVDSVNGKATLAVRSEFPVSRQFQHNLYTLQHRRR